VQYTVAHQVHAQGAGLPSLGNDLPSPVTTVLTKSSKRPAWATPLLCFIAFVGLLLFAVSLGLLNQARPGLSYTVTGTWMSLFLCIFAAAPLLADRVAARNGCCCCCPSGCCCTLEPLTPGFFWRYYHFMVAVISFLLALGWFIGGRPDGGVWGLSVLLLACIYLYLERQERVEVSKPGNMPPTVDLEAHNDTNIINPPQDVDRADSTASPGFSIAVASCGVAALRSLALVLYSLLLGGCWLQVQRQSFSPDGTFVMVSVNGVSQRILTQCRGPRSDVVPTIWVEVGGGGHSMSDLWGFRDFMADKFQRRICSYDMPGTGWSDPYLANQPQITAQVMEAMGEPGPFICLGSMDLGDLRCLKYCSAQPSKCRAVVPVSWGAPGEFQSYVDYYYAGDADKQKALVQSTCALRKDMGNIINFFAVSWGIIAAFLAAPDYEPKVTCFPFCGTYTHTSGVNLSHCIPHNCIPGLTILITLQTVEPPESVCGDLYPLPLSVPVLGFNLAQTPEQIDKTCKDWGYTVGSKDCGYFHYNYNKTIQTNKDLVARNPKSKLFLCGTDCDSAKGSSFVINQNTMIPWFANTLWDAIKDIKT
jgi:hypothetical protein